MSRAIKTPKGLKIVITGKLQGDDVEVDMKFNGNTLADANDVVLMLNEILRAFVSDLDENYTPEQYENDAIAETVLLKKP